MFIFMFGGGGGLCEGIFFFGIAMFIIGGGAASLEGLRLGMLHESKLLPLLLPSMVLLEGTLDS